MFTPHSVACDRGDDRPGTVGEPFWRICCTAASRASYTAVNAKHEEVLGLKAYKSIRDIPSPPVDLAVIATPAATVPQIYCRVRRGGYEIRGCDFCRIQGARTEGVAPRTGDSRTPARPSAPCACWAPNCLGLMNPKMGFECHLRPKMRRRLATSHFLIKVERWSGSSIGAI